MAKFAANRYAWHNPEQMRADVAEIVEAARVGGKRLANLTFGAVVQARNLTKIERVMLNDKVMAQLRFEGIVLWGWNQR